MRDSFQTLSPPLVKVFVAAFILGCGLSFAVFAAAINGSEIGIRIALGGYLVAAAVISARQPTAVHWTPWLLVAPTVPWLALFFVGLMREGSTEDAFAWA